MVISGVRRDPPSASAAAYLAVTQNCKFIGFHMLNINFVTYILTMMQRLFNQSHKYQVTYYQKV
jgi:hypothetical protein